MGGHFAWASMLTYWGRWRICASLYLTSIVSGTFMTVQCLHAFPDQCWLVVNMTLWNKVQWNFYQNSNIFVEENAFKMSSAKCRPICLDPNTSISSDIAMLSVDWATFVQLGACSVVRCHVITWTNCCLIDNWAHRNKSKWHWNKNSNNQACMAWRTEIACED